MTLDLQAEVDRARQEAGLVALGAVIATSQAGVTHIAVSGERVRGSGDLVHPDDAWHIGSNTKMLTALLYARLVESGHARWGATLPELFPALAAEMNPGWNDVTIEDLLSHRSGAAANPSITWMISSRSSRQPLGAQRANLARTVLKAPPAGERGQFVYSNLGYILAGAAIERLSADTPALGGQTYEQLMQTIVIGEASDGAAPGFGFGPPEASIEGHGPVFMGMGLKAKGRGPEADNPAALGPAGTAHHSLRGHALLLLSFLAGERSLPEPMRTKLLGPYPDDRSEYGLGWGTSQHEGVGRVFLHAGSNTIWLSQVVIVPDHNAVVIVNTNQYSPKAVKAVDALTERLVRHVSGVAD